MGTRMTRTLQYILVKNKRFLAGKKRGFSIVHLENSEGKFVLALVLAIRGIFSTSQAVMVDFSAFPCISLNFSAFHILEQFDSAYRRITPFFNLIH